MFKLIIRGFFVIKKNGFNVFLSKLINYYFSIKRERNFRKSILIQDSLEKRFTEIHNANYWGSEESVSGKGSTILYTSNLRKNLPILFKYYNIEKVFDSPCGDYNWMNKVVSESSISYVGADIVVNLVDSLNKKYSNNRVSFYHMDITCSKFPDADLMICRDCLFHLSYDDIFKFIKNFIESNIPLLLTTTHINNTNFLNKNIVSGDARLIDLFSAPFGFPKDVLFRIDDWIFPEPQREMCLWTRDQLMTILIKRNSSSKHNALE